MATVAEPISDKASAYGSDRLTRVSFVDRWIYVMMAAFFIVITLTGFIPDSLMKIEMVKAGLRPPFPLVLHFHAVLMGSFLLLLMAQTTLMATGRSDHHQKLGLASMIIVPALVVVGFILVPTTYHGVVSQIQSAPAEVRPALEDLQLRLDNIMLLQFRIGILFPLFIGIAVAARKVDCGLHKRMMILGTAVALPAAIDRITWLPHTVPESPVSVDLYVLLVVAPMFLWDVLRHKTIHRAYWIWLAIFALAAIPVHILWGTPGWHETAHRIMGV